MGELTLPGSVHTGVYPGNQSTLFYKETCIPKEVCVSLQISSPNPTPILYALLLDNVTYRTKRWESSSETIFMGQCTSICNDTTEALLELDLQTKNRHQYNYYDKFRLVD